MKTKTTRVLVANHPRLLRELILNTISEEVDIEIVGEVQQESELAAFVSRTHPDCVVVGLADANELPESCVALLREFPGLRVLAIARDGNSLKFFWAECLIRSKQLDASEATFLNALRGLPPSSARLQ